jgi:hypothetical protein
MPSPKGYFRQWSSGELTITLRLYDKEKGEQCLHLNWTAPLLGMPMDFQGIFIPDVFLSILKEIELLRNLADLPIDLSPQACQKAVESWGFIEIQPGQL